MLMVGSDASAEECKDSGDVTFSCCTSTHHGSQLATFAFHLCCHPQGHGNTEATTSITNKEAFDLTMPMVIDKNAYPATHAVASTN